MPGRLKTSVEPEWFDKNEWPLYIGANLETNGLDRATPTDEIAPRVIHACSFWNIPEGGFQNVLQLRT